MSARPRHFSRSQLRCGAAFAFGIALCSTAAIAGEQVLHTFSQHKCDPTGTLISDQSGNLYGTTQAGGSGFGTVFKLAPDGKETVVYAFTLNGNDGNYPYAGVISDSAGNLYGTTLAGGADYVGTVFKIAADGTESVLHSFTGGSDGAYPVSALLVDTAGNLYGTTSDGGSGACSPRSGCGTVFKIAADGTESILYNFQGGSDGDFPQAGLIMDSAGNLFGTTQMGGRDCSPGGCGTVFKIAADGTESVLYAFQNGSDGGWPSAGLVEDSSDNLYGTTTFGTVFKLAPDGTETVLNKIGGAPYAGLIMDARGNLYGTTSLGGGSTNCNSGCGSVFKIAPDGTATMLVSFDKKDGAHPMAGLLAGADGYLYGTTEFGGAQRDGVVYRVKK